MEFQHAYLITVIVLAVILFSLEVFSIDVIALLVLLSLILGGVLPLDQAFLGFGSETIVIIVGLLILTASLARNGVIELINAQLLARLRGDSARLTLILMGIVSAVSSFISNTAATALFIPVASGVARRTNTSLSKVLMPVAYAAILASSVSLIASSTNIVVSAFMRQYGLPGLGIFELTPVGLPIVIAGLIYMGLLGLRLIPQRETPRRLSEEFGLRSYLTEIVVLPSSPLVGKTFGEANIGAQFELNVVAILRGDQQITTPDAYQTIHANDILLVEATRDQILRIKEAAGLELAPKAAVSNHELEQLETRLYEAIILPRSYLIGRTLRGVGLRRRFGVNVLAIHRQEETLTQKLSQIVLRLGDVLLIQGDPDSIASLENNFFLRVLNPVEERQIDTRRTHLSLMIFAGVLLASGLGMLPLSVAILGGVILAFLTRCITPEEAYREVEWKVVILVGSMLALGGAVEKSGTAAFLAQQLVRLVGDTHPLWLLSGFFFLAMLLTQPMSNQAAAAVILPVAIQTALQLDLNPRTFAVMIAVGASTSFVTPLEPACLMVYGLGHYRFFDFVRVGFLLTLVIFGVAILLVPVIWPLS
ncbi:MAG: SLC13 family permease [Anaerolineales bacterium]|nr:SLC13 family permease [Anaerolineales bacterium]MCS7247564.1 SLC13 family permease [Anaerolineales bacterium]MDW8161375.1 SLC13 family permease [Anaerolineales bacterium]MDW8447972.1 SLC13 family permease [Anaerolineales bacterium]